MQASGLATSKDSDVSKSKHQVPSSTSDKWIGKIILSDLIPSESLWVNNNNNTLCMILSPHHEIVWRESVTISV